MTDDQQPLFPLTGDSGSTSYPQLGGLHNPTGPRGPGRTPTDAKRWRWPAIGAAVVIAIALGAAWFNGSDKDSAEPHQTVIDTTTTDSGTGTGTGRGTNQTPDLPPSDSHRPPPAPARRPASEVALNVSAPISQPPCDGSGIVVLGSAVIPGKYESEIQRLLNAHPGSSYLRTDYACPSLRQRSDSGNPIYAVYRPAGRTETEVCATVRAAGGDSYGKWLDLTTDPNFRLLC